MAWQPAQRDFERRRRCETHLYAASSWYWWGFTTAEDRQRLEAVIRRGIRSGLCAPDHMSL